MARGPRPCEVRMPERPRSGSFGSKASFKQPRKFYFLRIGCRRLNLTGQHRLRPSSAPGCKESSGPEVLAFGRGQPTIRRQPVATQRRNAHNRQTPRHTPRTLVRYVSPPPSGLGVYRTGHKQKEPTPLRAQLGVAPPGQAHTRQPLSQKGR